MMSDRERNLPSALSIDEIVQALKARAGYDVLYPEGPRREKIIEFVSRLRGAYPDAYDILGAGVTFEVTRQLRERALAVLVSTPNGTGFDWSNVTKHALIRSLEDLTVSMGSGKGRKEGIEIARTAPIQESRSRWFWRGRHE